VDRLLRIDMNRQEIRAEQLPDRYAHLGGRALTSRMLLDEVDPTCDPLGPTNQLIFAAGLLGATTASSSGRLSVGAKSPLTGGIKESNSGGLLASFMARRGYRAIVVENWTRSSWRGGPRSYPYFYLLVTARQAELRPADDLVGVKVDEACRVLQQRHGRDSALALCGPAGEMLLAAAGVAVTDVDGHPGRYAGRGGLGAVMAAKGLKAIVLTGEDLRPARPADQEAWRAAVKAYNRALLSNPSTAETMPRYGTALTLNTVNTLGGLPTRNFRCGTFERAEDIGGSALYDLITSRGGEGTPTHACMPGCVVRCSNKFPDEDGRFLTAPMEYETNCLMGSNLGIGDYDIIARLNLLCNQLGLDTIEVGAALGVAAEAGFLEFGDGRRAIELVKEIGEGTPLGRLLGSGALVTGKALGVVAIPQAKGQAIPAYDPRGLKANGVTYATSPMGADHTAGNSVGSKIDHTDPEGKVQHSRDLQVKNVITDSLGLCAFVRSVVFNDLSLPAALVAAQYGRTFTPEDLLAMAHETLRAELEFNRAAGFGAGNALLPEFFSTEPLSPSESVWDVARDQLVSIWSGITGEHR